MAHDALQILGRDAVAAGADLEDGAEPRLERLSRLLQQRARRQARLMAAVRTLEQEAVALAPQSRRAAANSVAVFGKSRHKPSWVSRVMAPLLVGAHVAHAALALSRLMSNSRTTQVTFDAEIDEPRSVCIDQVHRESHMEGQRRGE